MDSITNKRSLFESSHFWILLSLIAFIALPSKALDYGLLESTADEFLDAMGWSSVNLTILWFLPLIGFWLLPSLKLSTETQAKVELGLISFILLFAFISATIYKVSMGYSVIVLIATLTALATFAFAKLKMMQGDKFIIAALLSIILLIFFFIVYPTVAIFISMFYDGETFAPEQVVRILGQGYIVRVLYSFPALSALFQPFSV